MICPCRSYLFYQRVLFFMAQKFSIRSSGASGFIVPACARGDIPSYCLKNVTLFGSAAMFQAFFPIDLALQVMIFLT
jgi:hypothetical protein